MVEIRITYNQVITYVLKILKQQIEHKWKLTVNSWKIKVWSSNFISI